MNTHLKNLLAAAACALISFSCLGQMNYTYQLDMGKLENGQLMVRLTPPAIGRPEVHFTLPSRVPGYYDKGLSFGPMVAELIAYDKWGTPLEAERVKPNQWYIKDAQSLQRIEYKVRDIWKYRLNNSKWLPAENIFLSDKAFLINPGGLFGYFEGMENQPFHIYITRPPGLFACSAIKGMPTEADREAFSFPSYRELADHPILYSDQRPVSFQVANTTVEIGLFSENKAVSPERIKEALEPVLSKLADYMGGELPVEEYAFLLFFYGGDTAVPETLEHGNSFVWVGPEQWDARLLKAPGPEESLKRLALHKFLHIYAPMSIHSEEWLKFDFEEPRMSSHLWFYEGAPTYLSYHAQVNQGLIPEKTFFWFINDFLAAMKDYRADVSLAEVSRRAYGDLAGQYEIVELKGAMVCLLLDIELRSRSGGVYGLKHLLKGLAARYGRYKAFKDKELFGVIAEMTYPEIGEFLKTHVDGTKPLPFHEAFNKVGMEYDAGDNKIYPKPEASEEELALRKAWLFGE